METYSYFATDPVPGWELYTQARGLRSATGTFANLSGGTVRLELWNAIGSGPSLLRTSADTQQSTLTLPFVGAAVDHQPPTAPTNLRADAVGASTLGLSWAAATDNDRVASYTAYLDGSATPAAGCAAVTALSCTLTGLSASTTYTVTVRAVDPAGNVSPPSSPISVTTGIVDPEPPTAPPSVHVDAVTESTLSLSWAAATDNVAVVGYAAYLDGSATPAAGCAAVTALSCTLTGLSASTTYTVTVRAFDAADNISPPSSPISGTTAMQQQVFSTLYLLDGAAQGTAGVLGTAAGDAASSDSVPSAGGANHDGVPTNALVYEAHNLSGTYDASQQTQFALYIDAATSVGSGTQARIAYDFTGDGTWDRVETYSYFATDPVPGWERYDQTRGLRSATGTFANLSGGTVRLELWNAIGNGPTLVRTSADTQPSLIHIPFN